MSRFNILRIQNRRFGAVDAGLRTALVWSGGEGGSWCFFTGRGANKTRPETSASTNFHD